MLSSGNRLIPKLVHSKFSLKIQVLSKITRLQINGVSNPGGGGGERAPILDLEIVDPVTFRVPGRKN